MKIRSKIILIVLPLLITPLILTLLLSVFSARNGITKITTEFLQFKTKILSDYVNSQWQLLKDNNLESDEEFVSISKNVVFDFCESLIENEEELILITDFRGKHIYNTDMLELSANDNNSLTQIAESKTRGWNEFILNQKTYVSDISRFPPFEWTILIAVEEDAFFGAVNDIIFRNIILFTASVGLAVLLLFIFAGYLTRPLATIVNVIKNIIMTNDLSTKVPLQYNDETGRLGHYFNIMTDELDKAYDQMKKFALQAVIAEHKERKLKNIFKMYVPQDVIDRAANNPGGLIEGENRSLAILFSDIRKFTTISEALKPEELVLSLNKYFELMVNIITDNKGQLDKYIGDAIMAFFGAPVYQENDALDSVNAALTMLERLEEFNNWQKKYGREQFDIGIGISYGEVTIGNIGTTKKMDYTVIGDTVNLGSRLEGLTKQYSEPLLISDSLYEQIKDEVSCRCIDTVIVKGKTQGVRIYAPARSLSPEQIKAWQLHEDALQNYYSRQFEAALRQFESINTLLGNDYISELFITRCKENIHTPPPAEWTGAIVLDTK